MANARGPNGLLSGKVGTSHAAIARAVNVRGFH